MPSHYSIRMTGNVSGVSVEEEDISDRAIEFPSIYGGELIIW